MHMDCLGTLFQMPSQDAEILADMAYLNRAVTAVNILLMA